MKEVKKCSISGVAFTMDADAYQELENYLDSLKKTYKDTPDGAEIVADIEARIAELILTTQDNTRVVEKPLILNIIHQMGSVETSPRRVRTKKPPKSRVSRAASTATRRTPSWAAYAPASASTSTSIPYGSGWACSCRSC